MIIVRWGRLLHSSTRGQVPLNISGLLTKARSEIMSDIYEDLGHLMGELDLGESLLETMILNGNNEKANR